jgi:hypothetical protein
MSSAKRELICRRLAAIVAMKPASRRRKLILPRIRRLRDAARLARAPTDA